MSAHTPPSPFRPKPYVQHVPQFGPRIDTLGDVHGCVDEAVAVLGLLGHRVSFPADPNLPAVVKPAPGRAIAFVGDLTDRGPASRDALRLFEGAVHSGAGFGVMGNHDAKLVRALGGHQLTITHGLETTLEEMASVAPETRARWAAMLLALPHQIKAPTGVGGGDGYVTIVHAAAPTHHQDQENRHSLQRAHYGYADGSLDSHGHLIRDDWAQHYTGPRLVVHGHTPLGEPRLKNRVACIDTGAVFGGWMSALSLDTGQITQVASAVQALERPGVTRDRAIPAGTVRRFALEEQPIATRIHPRDQDEARG